MKKYCIKEEYIHRTEYHHYDDTGMEDQYQDEVYKTAAELRTKNGKILDIGCGSAYKLFKYFGDNNFTGSEIEPTLSWLRKSYPANSWIESSFTNKTEECYDVVICSDVIEHLVDPDELIHYIASIKCNYIVLSTPERDRMQFYQSGKLSNGPPQNLAHVREWSFGEFNSYINQSFDIVDHFLSKNTAEHAPLCQIVIAKNRK